MKIVGFGLASGQGGGLNSEMRPTNSCVLFFSLTGSQNVDPINAG